MIGLTKPKRGDYGACGVAKWMNCLQLLLRACITVFVVAACCGAVYLAKGMCS
jgi:hypothetical protein